jgi:hypothetical protein
MKKDSKVGTSSRHRRSVVRDYWQSQYKRSWLRLPLSTASFVSLGSRKASFLVFRTMLTG